MNRSSLENRCQICRVTKELCFCEKITALQTISKVSVIMHVSERRLTTNTANWIDLTLYNSKIITRGLKEERFNIEDCLDESFTPIYLYPHADAELLNDDFLASVKGPYNLIVPDGSWRQAVKVRSRERGLQKIPCVKLVDIPTSSYRLRRSPNDKALCTYEAVMYALKILESKETFFKMSQMFNLMVGSILQSRSGDLKGSQFLSI